MNARKVLLVVLEVLLLVAVYGLIAVGVTTGGNPIQNIYRAIVPKDEPILLIVEYELYRLKDETLERWKDADSP